RDALDLRSRVRFRVPGALDALFRGVPALAKIHSSGELAHNLKIQVPEPVDLQGRNALQRLDPPHGANVDVESQTFSQIEQPGLGALPDGQSVPLRPANRSQKYRVGFAAGVQRLVRKGRAYGIDGRSANGK